MLSVNGARLLDRINELGAIGKDEEEPVLPLPILRSRAEIRWSAGWKTQA